jgi:hypothetical protein
MCFRADMLTLHCPQVCRQGRQVCKGTQFRYAAAARIHLLVPVTDLAQVTASMMLQLAMPSDHGQPACRIGSAHLRRSHCLLPGTGLQEGGNFGHQ